MIPPACPVLPHLAQPRSRLRLNSGLVCLALSLLAPAGLSGLAGLVPATLSPTHGPSRPDLFLSADRLSDADAIVAASVGSPASYERIGRTLQAAFPWAIDGWDSLSPGGRLRLVGGRSFVLDDRRPKTRRQLFAEADIQDMFILDYPVGGPATAPPAWSDPGRYRCTAFLEALYGESPAAVQANLVSVAWMDHVLPFNARQCAAQALSAACRDLAARPDLAPFLRQPGGSFNWRVVAGTSTLSPHAFGIALDVNVALSNYWRDYATDEAAVLTWTNRIPPDLVAIMEAHGFIWGGRWYHFDTMHFEYRPELLLWAKLGH